MSCVQSTEAHSLHPLKYTQHFILTISFPTLATEPSSKLICSDFRKIHPSVLPFHFYLFINTPIFLPHTHTVILSHVLWISPAKQGKAGGSDEVRSNVQSPNETGVLFFPLEEAEWRRGSSLKVTLHVTGSAAATCWAVRYIRCFLCPPCLRGTERQRERQREREERAAPPLSLRRAVALKRVGSRRPPSLASTRRLTPENKFPNGACGFAPLLCLRYHFRTSALHPLCASLQCGGFIVPWPRCCFCFCCMRSCSSAEGPGCIIELDQIDWGHTEARV